MREVAFGLAFLLDMLDENIMTYNETFIYERGICMDNNIKERDLSALAEYQRQLWNAPKLKYLFFELTDKCNLSCQHCGSKCTNRNSTFLPLEIVNKILHSVYAEYGTEDIMICITGGEPLLHPDLFDVIRLAKDMGFAVGMTTNGTLISKKNAALLSQAGLDTVAISIDGLSDTHDIFRNSLGSFERALYGALNLRDVGIEPQVITVVHKNNFIELDDMYHMFSEKGFYSWRLVSVDPIGRARMNQKILLDANELRGLYDFIKEKRFDKEATMEVTYGCSHFLTTEYENELRDYYFQCGAGTLVASVMANGDIGACLDIERRPDLIQGNAYEDDFVDVWENRFLVFRRDRTCDSEYCSKCKSKGICMGDSFHTWDFDNNKPLYCVKEMISGGRL